MKETKTKSTNTKKTTTKKNVVTQKGEVVTPKKTAATKKIIKENKRVNLEDIKDLSKEEQAQVINDVTKQAKWDGFKEYMPYLIIIFFVILIRTFIVTPVNVNGTSMYPTLDNGDIMLLYKLKYKQQGAKRFDIVVIKTDSGRLIKRVIGLPGESVRYVINKDEDGKDVATLYIDDKVVAEKFISEEARLATCQDGADICDGVVKVPKGKFYVMGDNRGNSKDSRIIGPVSEDDILGITEFRIYPFSGWGNTNKKK